MNKTKQHLLYPQMRFYYFLCSQLCFLERLVLAANFAVLLVLQFFGNKFFILATVIHSPLADRTLQLN